MGYMEKYKRKWEYFERVEIISITPIDGWGVGIGEVKKMFKFYFCEVEDWFKKGDIAPLDWFLDYCAELPVYFFATWDAAQKFAHVTTNRYPIERRLYWLRFQQQYWFQTIFNAQLEMIRYLSDTERFEYIKQSTSDKYLGV